MALSPAQLRRLRQYNKCHGHGLTPGQQYDYLNLKTLAELIRLRQERYEQDRRQQHSGSESS